MANKTTNYNLTKPLESEFYDVEIQNENMDKIDTQMKANADAIKALQDNQSKKADLVDGKVPAAQLPDMDYDPTGTAESKVSAHNEDEEAHPHLLQQLKTGLANKVDKEDGKGLSECDYTTAEKQKLAALESYDDGELRALIGQKVDKEEGKGLSTCDYTAAERDKLATLTNYDDSALRTLIGQKVDKEAGKGLSSNDYTTTEKEKLASLSNYNDAAIKNDITQLQTDMGTAQQNISQLQNDTGTAQNNITELQTELGTAQQNITQLQTDVSSKVDKEDGKGLSSNDYTDADKAKVDSALQSTLSEIMLAIYPVGAIYLSTSSANPSILFGGTWEAWGGGRVPVGVDTSNLKYLLSNMQGGEETHTLTVDEMPAHTHWIAQHDNSGSTMAWTPEVQSSFYAYGSETTSRGGSQAHNNMPPYITCYMWRRTK